MKRRLLAVVLLLVFQLTTDASAAAQQWDGTLFGVFQTPKGDVLHQYDTSSRRFNPISRPFSNLQNPVAVGGGKFMALSERKLVLTGIVGKEKVLLENVNAFCFNDGCKLILALVGARDKCELLVLKWPGLAVVRDVQIQGDGRAITSRGNLVFVELDGAICQADLRNLEFSPLGQGHQPVLSHSGRILAYLTSTDRRLVVRDTTSKREKHSRIRWVEQLTWIGDEAVVLTYDKYSWIPLVPMTTHTARVDVSTWDKREMRSFDPPISLSWTSRGWR